MIHNKLVYLDYTLKTIAWDKEKLLNIKISENFLEDIIQKFKVISEETQKLIQVASCFGETFSLQLLLKVFSDESLNNMIYLKEAIENQFFIKKNSDNLDTFSNVNYGFLHTKIQEVVYSSIDMEEKLRYHYCIGKEILFELGDLK